MYRIKTIWVHYLKCNKSFLLLLIFDSRRSIAIVTELTVLSLGYVPDELTVDIVYLFSKVWIHRNRLAYVSRTGFSVF